MASTKTAKIEAEIEKTKAKISELQAKQRELEQKLIETAAAFLSRQLEG